MKSGLPEGITINHRTEVLNEDFKAIPGLYAAGADTACNIYLEICVNVLPGNAMGWALRFKDYASYYGIQIHHWKFILNNE